MRPLPPIAALRALEAAARHLSFTRASEELNVTQSAISHQIRHMEEFWGFKLFIRQKRGLVLSEQAKVLVPVIRDFLERMEVSLTQLAEEEVRGALKVSLLQSFAVKWLVPRLPDFQARHPDIDVWISTNDNCIDFADGEADMAIRLGGGNYPGLFCELMLTEKVFPACSPGLIEQYGMPETPSDLLQMPLLLRNNEERTSTWQEWFRRAGLMNPLLGDGPRFPDTNMALQAAYSDQGVALVRSAHVGEDLKLGRLVKLFDVDYESASAYYIVCPKHQEDRPKIKAFRAWLADQAIEARMEYDVLGI
ncbi:transcriptional regulator GcvA [Aestuariispira insulae]|uniref:LysR family glycine cleavage system transcriptional activator n=1 Tax=Aestuariispira insulae TaxID=1461337 RepID=A0A3D9HG86_9PROT|nr:transcriptional regulator GcvA [Aestuariispira insulae]RED48512.1 LysR family glycine cleavage system transcriptional activator [Aestuariispira insulae]